MKIPVAIKILNETTGPKANVEFMDVSTDTLVITFLVITNRLFAEFKKTSTTYKISSLEIV